MNSIINLIFFSNPDMLVSCGTLAPLANSDHYTVPATIDVETSSNPPRKQVWRYSQADLSLVNQLLKELPVASSTDNICKKWSQSLRSHREPMHTSQECPYQISWINREIRNNIVKRTLLLGLAEATRKQSTAFRKPQIPLISRECESLTHT